MFLRSGIGVESAKLNLKKTGAATLMDGNPVTHNEAKGQFEIALGHEKALLQYRRTDHSITLIHTEVPQASRGRGLGEQLIRAALDYAHFNQLKVVPVCPFVKGYLEKHPEAAK
jgi:predicted GNAT family acetyltransferase